MAMRLSFLATWMFACDGRSYSLAALSQNVYLFSRMFYLLIFGTAQHDLTGCGTGIMGVVLVEKVDRHIRLDSLGETAG